MRKTFVQGGSVKVFVIVGVILAILALTALYFVGKNFYSDQVPPMAVPESTVDEGEEAVTDEGEGSSTTDEEASAPSSDEPVTDTTDSTTEESRISSTNSQNDSATDPSGSLPQTGPSDDLATSIALVALTVSIASYIGSIRHLRTS